VYVAAHVGELADPLAGGAGAGAHVRTRGRQVGQLGVDVWGQSELTSGTAQGTPDLTGGMAMQGTPDTGTTLLAQDLETGAARSMVVHADDRLT